jgi:DNA adenine methylase
VPYGRWATPPTLFDEANLWACHEALQGVDLCEGSFEACVEGAGEGDFIYIDPPYAPLSKTSYFTSYFSTPFAREEQHHLAKVFQELNEKGCKVLLSNSDCGFVRELYGTWTLRSVSARRNINCKATRRGAVAELLILNYAP